MIYECTDCNHCVNYEDGFRIACSHLELGSNEVYKYQSLGQQDASECEKFTEGQNLELWFGQEALWTAEKLADEYWEERGEEDELAYTDALRDYAIKNRWSPGNGK